MAEKLTLIIGNKNYSSWSLRPWILLKYFDIPFKEILIPLYQGDHKKKILEYSPNGKVPALIHGKTFVWESLAICQYAADLFPEKKMWPQKLQDRAVAYSLAAEMHAGFANLRTAMPCNIRSKYPGKGINPKVEADIKRMTHIWNVSRRISRNKGPFLFGPFGVVDAMFFPVVTRFRTYGVALKGAAQEYARTMLALPAFKEWEKAAVAEKWVIERSEIYNSKYARGD